MFRHIKKQVLDQFDFMVATGGMLFITDANKDAMWDAYLAGFSSEEERQHHNCNCCKQFIRHYGSIVVINDYELTTVWDFVSADPEYTNSVEALSSIVKASTIRDKFVNDFTKLGTDKNTDIATQVTWEHFYVVAPKEIKVKKDQKETIMSDFRQIKQLFKNSLEKLTIDSSMIVLDLISQGSLYRGEEFEKMVKFFLNCQNEYAVMKEQHKDNFCWRMTGEVNNKALLGIKNTAIGTLLVNLSEGKDLDYAVSAWEQVMAPTNYKRPTALITKGMIEQAEKEIIELGIQASLGRRFAVPEDISVDNIIFVNRDAKVAANVFEALKEDLVVSPKSFTKVDEVSIDDFIEKVLPTATSVEMLVENSHLANLMSVIAPVEPEAPGLFKWNNPFSWSYVNALTDSVIKERVKAAGGNVNGVIRVSLSWFNFDDLDLWVTEPNGNEIGYNTYRKPKITPTSGQLDVDENAGEGKTKTPVENITWIDENKMIEGTYQVHVNQFAMRERENIGCIVEIEHKGEVFTFEQPQKMQGKTLICQFHYDKKKGLTFIGTQQGTSLVRSTEKWGINTNRFQKVSMIMNSPNHWKEQIGNKHVFFVLEGAKNDETPRGFFNEFLKEDLTKNRKVFEVLGAKLKVEPSDRQVTGVGFSTTQRNSVICKVEGNFTRTVKVLF
jgi:hypothetical protein